VPERAQATVELIVRGRVQAIAVAGEVLADDGGLVAGNRLIGGDIPAEAIFTRSMLGRQPAFPLEQRGGQV
jgi:hypothetical protein